MGSGKKKLRRDLAILEQMAQEMPSFLMSDVTFWPMMKGDMPRLTLGGYLLRQHRLLALSDLLDEGEKVCLETAVSQFDAARVEHVVRLEQKAHQELHTRLRQWGEHLKDFHASKSVSTANYSTDVAVRAMIEALIKLMQTPPYRLDPKIMPQVERLDKNLHLSWHSGAFVWPAEWMPAYPQEEYWWLYGHLK